MSNVLTRKVVKPTEAQMEKETQLHSQIKQIPKETHKEGFTFVITVSPVEMKTDGRASS